ncbi:MAG: anion permease, partial [Gordonibacter sp.]
GWMIIGVPIAAVMILVLWLSVTFVFKPESLSQEKITQLYESVRSYGAFLAEEKKTLFIILGVPILWILGTWLPLLNMTVVSVLAMGLMLAPGFNLLTFDEYQKGTPWNVVIMVGAMISMGSLLGSTGGSQFIGGVVLSMGFADMNIVVALLVLGIVLYLLHTVMPIGPGFVPVFFLPLVTICTAAGLNPISAAVMMSAIIGGNYLLPINPTIAITYSEDTYELKDMFKAGIVPVFVLCAVMALWIPFITGILTNIGMLYAV